MAQALLRTAGCPVAAPSANRSGAVSPTRAEHVEESLGGRIDLVLDGGACRVGLEYTILDLSVSTPTILRPGGLSREILEEALGCAVAVADGGFLLIGGVIPCVTTFIPLFVQGVLGLSATVAGSASVATAGVPALANPPTARKVTSPSTESRCNDAWR